MIYLLGPHHKIPENEFVLDVTSWSKNWGKYLSPFNLGPVDIYDGYWAHNLENAYQFTKVYPEYANCFEEPNSAYFEWAQKGWQTKHPIKYPMGAWNQHLFHWWKGKKITNLEAQNLIFLPSYAKVVQTTDAFKRLKNIYETSENDIYLKDFEGYDYRALGMTWDDVVNDPNKPVGQGFALAMILEGYLK